MLPFDLMFKSISFCYVFMSDFGTGVYHHDRMCQEQSWSWYKLTFDLKVKFIVFMTLLCVQASAFLSFDIVILYLARECITMVRCVVYIHKLCMTLTSDLNMKIISSPWIWDWQDVFALSHRYTKFWHMGASPEDNMLYTFLTLTFVGDGGILSEFYSRFLSC